MTVRLSDKDIIVSMPPGVDKRSTFEGPAMPTARDRVFDWRPQAITQLQSLSQYAENWDGYGAAAPQPPIIDSAKGFLDYVFQYSDVPRPYISPSRTGGVVFEWENGPNQMEVEIVTDMAAEYSYLDTETGIDCSGCLFIDDADDGRFLRLLGQHFGH